MNFTRMHWVHRLVALACIAGPTVGIAAAAGAQSINGQAYGVYVNTPLGGQAQSPLAVLPAVAAPNGDMADAAADGVNVPNALSSDFLNSTTTGAIGTAGASAQSMASVADVNILGGLITAKEVIATSTSSRTERGATSNANGSTFESLVVAGASVTSGDAAVAPNTRITLPNVGYVVLNEQVLTGDGVTSSGVTVNMIHVVLQQAVLGPLGQVIDYRQMGEVIVGSATSAVGS